MGTQRLKMLPTLVENAARSPFAEVDINPWDDVTFPLGITRRGDPVKAYVTIIEGLQRPLRVLRRAVRAGTNGCARRPTSSRTCARPPIRAAARSSCSARSSITTRRPTIRRATSRSSSRPSTRFPASSASVSQARIRATPARRLIEAVRDLPKVCKHLHLPVQSGSTRVLQRDAAAVYARGVPRAGRADSRDHPGGDVIDRYDCWFPGETAADFEQTLSLTEAAQYHSMFSFKYSPRPNTLAIKRLPDDVSAGGEDGADRGAPVAAAGDSNQAARAGGRDRLSTC